MASTDGNPWFYPDLLSAAAGEKVTIHASSVSSPCQLVISRVGAERVEYARFDSIDVPNLAIPDSADECGCDWASVFTFEINAEWPSGYYDLEMIDPSGSSTHHFVCVRPTAGNRIERPVIVLNTNTYLAYNYWGGANSYAHVDSMMSGERDANAAMQTAIGRLSQRRPFAQALLAPPPDAPRLVNLQPRAVGEMGFPGTAEFLAEHLPSPYDGSAGFLHKWEHAFVAWAEKQGLSFDFVTDYDFDRNPHLVQGYETVFLVGHSEYWSGEQRRQLDEYTNAGGNLAIFSGNTAYWKVRWEDDGATMVAHKLRGETNDPLWRDEATRGEATHLWSHPAFGRPEAEVTGLSFIYGGYHRLVMCVARGTSAYTVYDDAHWALADTDLYYGDAIGGDVPLLGYENDGCPIRFDHRGLPVPDGGLGVPENLEIIALAPAMLFEPPDSPFPPVIPPENPEVLARIAYGLEGEEGMQRVNRGHAVLASFKKGRGEVFNAGTTEWAHGLAATDPFVEKITWNVIRRFCPELAKTLALSSRR